jgi:hypothetical protein
LKPKKKKLAEPRNEKVGEFFYETIIKVWHILLPLGNLVTIWYVFSCFGILYQDKSGNHASNRSTINTGLNFTHCVATIIRNCGLCHADGSKPGSGTKMMEQKELMRWISHN